MEILKDRKTIGYTLQLLKGTDCIQVVFCTHKILYDIVAKERFPDDLNALIKKSKKKSIVLNTQN